MGVHPQAESLAQAFISNFWASDHSITWKGVEEEKLVWLTPTTALVGRVDAYGLTEDGERFFGEWKTISAYKNLEDEKAVWRFDPQALTYGLFFPTGTRFTVRWAQKKTAPVCAFEWYTYSAAEMNFWRAEVILIANRIRELRAGGNPWPINPTRCFRYGRRYVCPFFESGCSKLNFDGVVFGLEPRVSHLAVERELMGELDVDQQDDVVVLDATRIEEWLGCNEAYRRKYEHGTTGGGLSEPTGEALRIGTDFHALLGVYYKGLMEGNLPEALDR